LKKFFQYFNGSDDKFTDFRSAEYIKTIDGTDDTNFHFISSAQVDVTHTGSTGLSHVFHKPFGRKMTIGNKNIILAHLQLCGSYHHVA